MVSIKASSTDGISSPVNYRGTPDECPMCHMGIQPRIIDAVVTMERGKIGSELRIIYQCIRDKCQQPFLSRYIWVPDPAGEYYGLVGTSPKTPVSTAFSDSIRELSPNFVQIYNQAIAAEADALDEISGIGFRKALEFLVKDFLISQDPGKTDEIKRKLLGACINEDVTDPNIKASAKLATWLGNDEAHYVRKWEDKDIKDLKILIRLTVNWIDNVLLTQKYVATMNP